MERETILALALVAALFMPAAYSLWRGLVSLSRSPGPACGGCGSAPTCSDLRKEAIGAEPVRLRAPDTRREMVLYVSHLTKENATRFHTRLGALDGVESIIIRPSTRTLRVSYRPTRLTLKDMVSTLTAMASAEISLCGITRNLSKGPSEKAEPSP